MKIQILLILSLMSPLAMADLRIFCHKGSVEECEDKVVEAMDQMSCEMQDLECETFEIRPWKTVVYCQVATTNCQEPSSDLFGFYDSSVYCWNRSDEFVNLKKIDRNLTLDWTFGFIRKYVHHVCVKN